MSMTYKIHPSIGIARLGDSDEYYLAPETAGGLPLEPGSSDPVTSFRDHLNKMRRQAARFKIYAYDGSNRPTLVTPGQNGVESIEWTVHLANKKAAWRQFRQLEGESGYPPGHPCRNPKIHDRNSLILDPGSRTLTQTAGSSHTSDFSVGPLELHPYTIRTLGEMRVDSGIEGLQVLGGFGASGSWAAYDLTRDAIKNLAHQGHLSEAEARSLIHDLENDVCDIAFSDRSSFSQALQAHLSPANQRFLDLLVCTGQQPRIDIYANNEFWHDDVADGPVTAKLNMAGGSQITVDAPSWVIVGPPAYAPQIVNMITLHDAMYDTFVRNLEGFQPELYSKGSFKESYIPNFAAEIRPILTRPDAYKWVAGINDQGRYAHETMETDPSTVGRALREPGDFQAPRQMPYLAGDNPISDYDRRNYLTLTETQYFLLQQWIAGRVDHEAPVHHEGPGEALDRASLENCVGGAFCPGIEMTWICRNLSLYSEPYRIKHKPPGGQLGPGEGPDFPHGLEPGDITKFMAVPWQADFNECSIQPIDSANLWWWPAQRPFEVYTSAAEFEGHHQVYWTRPDPDGDFRRDVGMVKNWKNLGFIRNDGSEHYLEVDRGTVVPDPDPECSPLKTKRPQND